jgi:hypothetical protein
MTPRASRTFQSLPTVDIPTTTLFRLSKGPAKEPYFGKSGRYRFDSPTSAYGVLYCGDAPQTSFAESVLHSAGTSWNSALGGYVVNSSEINKRSLVTFKHPKKATLKMADLTGAALKRMGLNNDISAGPDYTDSQALSALLHARHPKLDGICFVSRQINTRRCFAIFNRSGLVLDSAAPLPQNLLNGLCQMFNVVVLPSP